MSADATRRGRDGSTARIEVGRSHRERFTEEAKALVKSVAAIELALLLKKHDGHTARMCRAVVPFKFERTDKLKEQTREVSRDRSLSPSRREDLKKGLYGSAWSAQHAAWRQDRRAAHTWLRVLRLYLASRDWLLLRDPRVRAGFARSLERQVEKLARNEVQSSSKEEARRRARNRTELTRHNKRSRRQFGWRGAGDGRTVYLIPGPDGSYDPTEVAKHEAAMLFAEQLSGEANHGLSVKRFEVDTLLERIVREEEQEQMTEEDRQAEALTELLGGEVAKFMRKKNGTSN